MWLCQGRSRAFPLQPALSSSISVHTKALRLQRSKSEVSLSRSKPISFHSRQNREHWWHSIKSCTCLRLLGQKTKCSHIPVDKSLCNLTAQLLMSSITGKPLPVSSSLLIINNLLEEILWMLLKQCIENRVWVWTRPMKTHSTLKEIYLPVTVLEDLPPVFDATQRTGYVTAASSLLGEAGCLCLLSFLSKSEALPGKDQ